MPRFFLDVCNTQLTSEDEAGADFADLDSARREAIKGIRSILTDELANGKINLDGEVRIFNEARELLLTVPYSEAVTVLPPKA